jgi:predicted DNA binding CopG/RHH family protein
MAIKKQPLFKTETQEADWWARNQELIADRFDEAKVSGKLRQGELSPAPPANAAAKPGASPTITIRPAEADLVRARTFAAEKGLPYQTYLKMLLHQALNSEEKRARRH